ALSPHSLRGFFIVLFPYASCLQSFAVNFACANPHGALDIQNENLAVADFAGMRGLRDRFHDLIDQVGGYYDLDLVLGQEAHVIFRATIYLGLTLLAAKAL